MKIEEQSREIADASKSFRQDVTPLRDSAGGWVLPTSSAATWIQNAAVLCLPAGLRDAMLIYYYISNDA
jgi:hypothetical protein